MPRQVNLTDGVYGQRRKIRGRAPAMIATADVDVIDVAQDAAAGALRDGGDELPFGNDRLAVLKIRRRILDENLPLQIRLRLLDMAANDIECFFGHRQRQEVGNVDPVDHAPGQMLRDEARLEALDDLAYALQMSAIERLGAAQRQAHAVQSDRVIAAN